MGPSETINVLIVEDHTMVAEGLANSLGRFDDINVIGTAGSVQSAWEMAREKHPDVILMDYGLPDGTGAHATELIKKDVPETYVVMVTSLVDDDILISAIEAGCSGYVTKHRPVEDVADAIRAVNAGEALISPAMLARLLPKLRKAHRGIGADLTQREIEVLGLLATGISNKVIADQLVISLKTVRNHVQNILMKLQAHSKLEAVATAVREEIIKFGM